MIAHRLSTLENCDLLLTIENGRLIEQKATDDGVHGVLCAAPEIDAKGEALLLQ
jgi:ABC-type transport system involved in Fe-S cluster assembly fused permease/ATPase subunit